MDHGVLDHVPTSLIDRVGYVGVHFVRSAPSLDLADVLWASQTCPTLVAVTASEVILVAAFSAARGHLSARHGDKWSVHSLNDLQIANDERMIYRDRTKSAKAIFRLFHQFDADLGYFHGVYCTPFRRELVNSRFVSNSLYLLFDP